MVLIVSVVVALGLGLGAAWVLGSPRQQSDRAAESCWRNLAESLDFDYDPGGLLQGPQITGTKGELSIVIDTFFQSREGRKALFTRVVVSGESVPESLDSFQKAKNGDPPAKRILASVTRRYVRELVKHIGATVANGRVKWLREGAVWHPHQTAKILKRLLEITEFLAIDPHDEAARLVTCFSDESIPETLRREIQTILFQEFKGTDACEVVARETMDGKDYEMQVAAAKALGEAGLSSLATIVRSFVVKREIREQAMAALLTYRDPQVVFPHVENMLRDKVLETVRLTMKSVRKYRYQPALRTICEIALEPSTSNDVLALMIDAMADLGSSAVETTLLALLDHQFVTIRRQVCRALGLVGTGNALVPLERLGEKQTENKKLRELALTSARAIRDRHGIEKSVAEAV